MTKKVLFLCPHNAAKSVLAAAYFQQQAEDQDLDYIVDTAGTEPSEQVSQAVAEALKSEGMNVDTHLPRLLNDGDLLSADYIFSMGCDLSELNTGNAKVEYWNDVPATSEDMIGAQNAIRAHVETLIKQLDNR